MKKKCVHTHISVRRAIRASSSFYRFIFPPCMRANSVLRRVCCEVGSMPFTGAHMHTLTHTLIHRQMFWCGHKQKVWTALKCLCIDGGFFCCCWTLSPFGFGGFHSLTIQIARISKNSLYSFDLNRAYLKRSRIISHQYVAWWPRYSPQWQPLRIAWLQTMNAKCQTE